MAAPVMTTGNSAGNLLASTSIAASGTTTFTVDVSAKFGAIVQIAVTFGTVAATSGLQIDAFARIGSGPATDTEAVMTSVIPSTASTAKLKTIRLDVGRWQIKLTNLDATNGVTLVTATDDTIDSVA